MREIRPPPALQPGETIAIFAPAGQLQDGTLLTRGVKILREMGFLVRFPRDLWPGSSYLADSDENRSREFNRLVRAPGVKGLLALRGGYGCLRMLQGIDLDLLARQPKMIIGFSDLSVLQNYIYARIGLISMHGPVLTSLPGASPAACRRLYQCLTGDWRESIAVPQVAILRDAPTAQAPLVGGNLASLVSLLGTPYDSSWREKIIFLEDVNEPLYKVDRMLTQLWLAGKFSGISGLILGDFSMTGGSSDQEHQRSRESLWQRILELVGNRQIPVWANFPCGHCPGNLTLPLGAVAIMDRQQTSLFFAPSQ